MENIIIAIGFTMVNASLTMMSLKLYTEYVKDKLQAKRKTTEQPE